MQLVLGCSIVLHRSRRLFHFSARPFFFLVVWHQITCNLFPSCWWPWPADCQPLLLHMKQLPGARSDKQRRSGWILQVSQASKLKTCIWVTRAGLLSLFITTYFSYLKYTAVVVNPILGAPELQSLFPRIPVFFVRAVTNLVGWLMCFVGLGWWPQIMYVGVLLEKQLKLR